MYQHNYHTLGLYGLGRHQRARKRRERARLVFYALCGLVALAAILCRPAHADGLHLAVGLGVHDPAYDWHLHPATDLTNGQKQDLTIVNPHQTNPMGIVQLTYQTGRFTFGLVHISSIPNKTDDHGLNMAYVAVNLF